MRAPFQVVVFLYRFEGTRIKYLILRRADDSNWQGVAGGGEDDETPIKVAIRECGEETGIYSTEKITELQTVSSIPVCLFNDRGHWDEKLYVIPEYCFGMETDFESIRMSCEHREIKWCTYEEALSLLKYDSNKTALWELNERLFGQASR